ncbi:MAG: NF038129 family PEP-CTERM protein [Acidobacteria bacterium]|nr:NF038129 family PEP-CTERM protein [Acidobacteriota bacterium]
MIRTILALFTLTAALSAAPVGYRVFVDTSAFAGLDGQAEFQFNPGGAPDAATATLSALAGVASFSENSRAGDVTGADPWVFQNTAALNMLVLNLQGLTSNFSFQIVFSGDAIDNPVSFDGTAFALTMRDSSGVALGGFSEPTLWLDLTGGVFTTFIQDQQIELADIPEPSTIGLLLSGALFIALRRRAA